MCDPEIRLKIGFVWLVVRQMAVPTPVVGVSWRHRDACRHLPGSEHAKHLATANERRKMSVNGVAVPDSRNAKMAKMESCNDQNGVIQPLLTGKTQYTQRCWPLSDWHCGSLLILQTGLADLSKSASAKLQYQQSDRAFVSVYLRSGMCNVYM